MSLDELQEIIAESESLNLASHEHRPGILSKELVMEILELKMKDCQESAVSQIGRRANDGTGKDVHG